MVKQLRDLTGAGVMDCKNILVECDGDQEKAIAALRKKGAQMADSRAGRTASEGLIVCKVSESGSIGALVEVSCETDFVSRGDVFRDFAVPLGDLALSIGEDCDDVEVLKALPFGDSGSTVEDMRLEVLSKIRENINVQRMAVFKAGENARIGSYVHRGRIGVMIEVIGDAGGSIGDDMAIHVAVMKPGWVSAEEIPESVLAKEREISGEIKKFTDERVMLSQPYYEDEDKSVETVLKEANASIRRFCRLAIGEGNS